MSGDPLPLDIIGGLIAMRASVMTGVDTDEIRFEMGPGRILKTPAPNGRRWAFDGVIMSHEIRIAVEQATAIVAAAHPVASD